MARKKTIASVMVTTALACGMVWWIAVRMDRHIDTVRTGFQDADVPPGMVDRDVDGRCLSLSPAQSAQIPLATRFDLPLGTEHGALAYNAQPYLAMNQPRGGPHLGDDLNGIGGKDSDLGDPVYACADGLVVFTGKPSPGWGNVVIVAHRTSDGRILESMYAHLDRILVSRNRLVARGEPIGSVGTADGNYLAHLHVELRASRGMDMGGGYGHNPLNRLNPVNTMISLRQAATADLAAAPLATLRETYKPEWKEPVSEAPAEPAKPQSD